MKRIKPRGAAATKQHGPLVRRLRAEKSAPPRANGLSAESEEHRRYVDLPAVG